jgi:putative ABC transport system permease protein
MLKTYFKVSWRNIVRDKQFTILNLLGLSIGLACSFLIYLWIADEQHVDTFNKDGDRLFQVMKNSPVGDGPVTTTNYTPALMAQSMAAELPEIEYAVSVIQRDKGILSVNDKHIRAKHIFAGGDFFNVFSLRLLNGDRHKLLAAKDAVLISSAMAERLFNTTENVVGKTVTWNWWTNMSGVYTIGGIFEGPPPSASLQADIIFSHSLWVDNNKDTYWGNSNADTYVRLKKGVNAKQFSDKIKNYSRAKYQKLYGTEGLQWIGTIFLQRYSDKYLHNRYENGFVSGGRVEYVRLFAIIAIFIIAIAAINFMNLATAKASGRMKEIGIRKVAGAQRYMLVLHYFGESLLMCLLSFFIAIILVALLLPQFNQVTGKNMHFSGGVNLILPTIGITALTGILAGSYPALYLSSFKPALTLKGVFKASYSALLARKCLVVFQFVLSSAFIIAVLVIYRQLDLIQTKNLGYNKENVVRFANEGKLSGSLQTFFEQVRKIPGVINVSGMSGDLVGNHGGGGGIDWTGKMPNQKVEFSGLYVDYGLIETLGFKMAEGRSFSPQFGTDSTGVIFNEAAITSMHLTNPIGQTVKLWGSEKQIIGIVKDFHFESLYKSIGPFFFSFTPHSPQTAIRIKGGTERETLARLATLYKEYNPGVPFEYKFLDDDYQALYASEQRVSVLSRYFAGVTIIISCLGLFGLAAFTAQKRRKEIGIRKVIGASVINVTLMLSKDFLKLVLVAVSISFPLAWLAIRMWLQGFAYHINMGVGIFLLAGASIVFITLLAISFQTVKAAAANPIIALRNE